MTHEVLFASLFPPLVDINPLDSTIDDSTSLLEEFLPLQVIVSDVVSITVDAVFNSYQLSQERGFTFSDK